MFNKIIEYATIVGRQLGKGYSENIYHEALCTHLRRNSILYSKEQIIPVNYKIEDQEYVVGNLRADIVLPNESLIIECKAVEGNLRNIHIPQLITYLNILQYKNGILINFNQNPTKELVEFIRIERLEEKYKVNDDLFNIDGTKLNDAKDAKLNDTE